MAGNKKMKVIGMTGQTGGRMKELCDIVLCVPHDGDGSYSGDT